VAEAWARADEWAPLALEAALLVAQGDPQAIADLQAVSGQLEDMNALGCALLGHFWTATGELLQSGRARPRPSCLRRRGEGTVAAPFPWTTSR